MEVQHRAVGSARAGLPSWPGHMWLKASKRRISLAYPSGGGQELHVRQTLRLLGREIAEQSGLVMT